MNGSKIEIEFYSASFGTHSLYSKKSITRTCFERTVHREVWYHENLFRVTCTPQELDQIYRTCSKILTQHVL